MVYLAEIAVNYEDVTYREGEHGEPTTIRAEGHAGRKSDTSLPAENFRGWLKRHGAALQFLFGRNVPDANLQTPTQYAQPPTVVSQGQCNVLDIHRPAADFLAGRDLARHREKAPPFFVLLDTDKVQPARPDRQAFNRISRVLQPPNRLTCLSIPARQRGPARGQVHRLGRCQETPTVRRPDQALHGVWVF
jgi:hypothetical protein